MKPINLILVTFVFLFLGCKKEEYNDNIISESISLEGTKWGIFETKKIPIPKSSGGPVLWFGEDTVAIFTNCNMLSSEFKVNGTSIQLGNPYSTYKYCTDMNMEAYFHSNLKKINSYKYSRGILYLYIGTKMIASFKRIEDI